MKIKVFFLFCFVFQTSLFCQEFVINGSIQEDLSREPISLANIYIENSGIGTVSNDSGYFRLSIPRENFLDTIVISSIGYKEHRFSVNSVYPDTNLYVFLQDSMILIDEVVAFCYDYIEALYWNSKTNEKKDYLLTFVSKKKSNVSNFILLLNERFGIGKKKRNSYIWKNLNIPGIEGDTKVKMKFFRCGYCPDQDNITITFKIENSTTANILQDDESKLLITRYFQEILDQTFENGINISQLEKRNRIYYLPEADSAYSGKVYGYFESGKKGLRGELILGKKDKKWEYWYQNDKKRMVAFFDKGKKEGLWVSWYKDGSIRIKNNYVNGRLDANNFWWHENGELKKVALYKNGIIQGKLEWEKNSTLKEQRGIFEKASDEEIQKIRSFKLQDQKIEKYLINFL